MAFVILGVQVLAALLAIAGSFVAAPDYRPIFFIVEACSAVAFLSCTSGGARDT